MGSQSSKITELGSRFAVLGFRTKKPLDWSFPHFTTDMTGKSKDILQNTPENSLNRYQSETLVKLHCKRLNTFLILTYLLKEERRKKDLLQK